MTKDEALKLALEALEADELDMVDDGSGNMVFRKEQAIAAIKKALSEPKQEPLAWISTGPASMIHWTSDKPAYGDDWVPLYTTPPPCPTCEALAQTQEPVAWEQFYPDFGKPQIAFNAEVIGYVAPQQEPVAWGVFEGNLHDMFFTEAEAVEMAQLKGNHAEVKPLYTQPQRKPLTDEDVERIVREARVEDHGIGYTIARAIEAAHNIKE